MSLAQRIIIFERMALIETILAYWYEWRGYKLITFDNLVNIKSNKLARRLYEQGKLTSVYANHFVPAHGQAIDTAQRIVDKWHDHPIVKIIRELYQSDDVVMLFKKGLVEELFNYYFIRNYLLDLVNQHQDSQIIFYSFNMSDIGDWLAGYAGLDEQFKRLQAQVKLINVGSGWFHAYSQQVILRVAMAMYVMPKMMAAFIGRLRGKSPILVNRKTYAVAIGSRLEVEHGGDRGYDLLVDNDNFTNDNMVFIDLTGLAPSLLARERAKGRDIVGVKEVTSPTFLCQYSWQMSWAGQVCQALVSIWGIHADHPFFLKVMFIALQRYTDWQFMLQSNDFKHLIFTNQENIQMSAINLLMRDRGKITWNYSCFLGGGYLKAKDKDWLSVRNIHWSFLIYDHFIGVNTDVIEYYKTHHQQVANYHAVGSLFSQLIHEKIDHHQRKIFMEKYFPNVPDIATKKLIAIFDTAFVDAAECLTNYEDGQLFYKDMARLLANHQEYVLFFKPAKSPAFYGNPSHPWSSPRGVGILAQWQELAQSNRVHFASGTKVTAKGFIDFSINNELMAHSDVVITHCLSSTTGEALGASKKAFWYESRWRHTDIDYDKIPGLIIHGYDALEQRLASLLAQSSEAHQRYLDAYIKGKVEIQLDAKALTKFKQLLITQ